MSFANNRAHRTAPVAVIVAVAVCSLGVWISSQGAALHAQEEKAGDTFVSREVCGECHEDQSSQFLVGPHGRAMARVDPQMLERSCVACHGPGEQHVEDIEATSIRLHPGDESCASCHGEKPSELTLASSGHRRQGVECLACHASGHDDSAVDHLLQSDPVSTCGSCHQTEAAAFHLPFAHRDGSEPFACTECHSSHGQTTTGTLALFGRTEVCTSCHAERTGPFVFPHPVRDIDGCVACHQPHGSPNPRLLIRRQVLALCLECHADTPAFHDLTQARFRACSSCHIAVHGSNRDRMLLDE